MIEIFRLLTSYAEADSQGLVIIFRSNTQIFILSVDSNAVVESQCISSLILVVCMNTKEQNYMN